MVENPLIHIVSCSPRSGTTLFHEVMTSCFDVQLSYDSEKSIFRTQVIQTGVTVTKDPNEVFYMRYLLAIEPRLHVIYLSRDPRDVASSVHKGSLGEGYFTGIKKWVEFQGEFDKIKDHPRVLEVKYADLVSAPDEVQARVCEAFPFLKKQLPFSSYHQNSCPSELSLIAMNGLRPISTKSLAAWKNNLPRIKQQLSLCPELPEVLVRYGYEQDDGWLNLLEKVPSEAEGRDEVRETSIHSFKIRYRIFRKCLWYWLTCKCFNAVKSISGNRFIKSKCV